MTRATRALSSAALILALTMAATACTPTLRDSVSAEHASEQMQALVRDTMQAAGGSWTSLSDGPPPDPCTTPAGHDGVTFSWDQTADGVTDPGAAVERVEQVWRDQGLAANTQTARRGDGRILHRVGSTGKDVDSILFGVTTSGMTIEVQSLCGLGDVDDFYRT
ncbi:hypothetical protein [Curtobacterium sp. MCBA15_001]|uniref:hypothetical protein n=1 Tax=Curtobacterium sp. MCBA15_001 TaxID=1898731 RepID=UPI0008DD09EA|nr:hypothetical protein [Curtobacterium sp. MCBA15_001]OIH92835.1 hypothetical protein BIU90_10100 [Curtobacterium sp. MCBA15_001]